MLMAGALLVFVGRVLSVGAEKKVPQFIQATLGATPSMSVPPESGEVIVRPRHGSVD